LARFYYLYDNELPDEYNLIDSVAGWAWLIAVLGAFFAGISAFYIPERYQKQQKPKQNKEP